MTTARTTLRRAAATLALAALAPAVPAAAVPAAAGERAGSEVGGTGTEFYLSDTFGTEASTRLTYGRPDDEVYVGDWDGNGTDTLALRRGATFYLRSTNTSGPADTVVTYGRPGDVVLVGDWDGDGRDTFAVRRGAEYLAKNSLSGGPADDVAVYGRPGDVVLVGDWDGDTRDTFAVRRGARYLMADEIRAGEADREAVYGRPDDDVHVGDWDGDTQDTLTVRRGTRYFVANQIRAGEADREVVFGRAADTTLVGDWDGDGVDSLGVRRDPQPATHPLASAGGLTGTPVPYAAAGTLAVVPGSRPAPGGADRTVRVRVEVERGLPVVDEVFADVALDILNDRRGWGADGSVAFARTSGPADLRLILASPATTDALCAGLRTNGYTSCRVGDRAVINAQRWAGGARAFNAAGGTGTQYRQYVINHEVGHYLGRGHRSCPAPGRTAPVMQQQTLQMGGCRPNGWPHP